jgi:hypothetical protein
MTAPALTVPGVTPNFEVEFTENVDVVRRGPLATLWSTRFEQVSPVRWFPSFRGQKSFSGSYGEGQGRKAGASPVGGEGVTFRSPSGRRARAACA